MADIDRTHLAEASAAGIVTPEQAERLWAFLAERVGPGSVVHPSLERGPRFTFTNVLYYLGGMLAIGAMSLFMTLGWERFGGWGVAIFSCTYMAVAYVLANRFEAEGHAVPMGILATLVVVLVPLATWGVQHALGFWAGSSPLQHYENYHRVIEWRWITLELATLVAGVGVLYRFKAPFLVMPLAVTLWYVGMDLAMWFLPAGVEPWSDEGWNFRKWFSVGFGFLFLVGAYWVDLRSRFTRDYAFWLYLFGLATFWGGLSSLESHRLTSKLVYLGLNIGLVLIGAALVRRAFTVFGAIGIASVLIDLSQHYFKDSWLFPIALTLIGLAIVFSGIWWSRNETRISVRLQRLLPVELRELIATRRASAG